MDEPCSGLLRGAHQRLGVEVRPHGNRGVREAHRMTPLRRPGRPPQPSDPESPAGGEDADGDLAADSPAAAYAGPSPRH